MNNKTQISFLSAVAFTEGSNDTWRASGIDSLIMFSNVVAPVSVNAGSISVGIADSFFLPEGLQSTSEIGINPVTTRQDVKKLKPVRIPNAIVGCGLITLSQADNMEQYFSNSVSFQTDSGWVRYGVCNFTATEAVNPLADGQQSVRNAIWSFFKLG